MPEIVLEPIGRADADIRRRIANEKAPPGEPEAGRLIYPAAIQAMLLAHCQLIRRRIKAPAPMIDIADLFDRGAAIAQSIDALTADHCGGFREPDYVALVESAMHAKRAARVDVVAPAAPGVFAPGPGQKAMTASDIKDMIRWKIDMIDLNIRRPAGLDATADHFTYAARVPRIWRALSPGETGAVAEDIWCSAYCAVFHDGAPLADAVRPADRGSPAKG